MATKHISQREAIRNSRELKRVKTALEEMTGSYPGTTIVQWEAHEGLFRAVHTAEILGYTVIAKAEKTPENGMRIRYRAIKPNTP